MRKFFCIIPICILLSFFAISLASGQGVKSYWEDQVARDSQRINTLEVRLASLETAVTDINSNLTEAKWLLRGLIVGVSTELVRRLLANRKEKED